MKKSVMKAAKDYKKSDHLMVRKTFGMKDVVYKKSAPSRELWKSEVAFDVNFCFVAVAAAAAFVILCAVLTKTWHCLCRSTRHFARCRRRA